MANETIITIIGNLTNDPELRFTQSGTPVADFTIASTPRAYDKTAGQWKDGETLFMRCSVWREAAENVAESLRKGMRVIAQGRLTQRSYETREGEHRTIVELQVDEIGPSLRTQRAQITRANQQQGTNAYSGQPMQQATYNAPAGGQAGDPWATNQPTNTPMPQGQATPFENAYDQAPF